MKFLKAAAVAAALTAASPALADEFFAVTPSRATEMVFGERPSVVIGKLSSRCIDSKWTVVSSSSNELVCEAPLNMGQAILGQMLMGNSYSTPPRRFFKFNVAEAGGISRVQASGWMELQMAFGQVKRNAFSGPQFHNGAMGFMSGAGGTYPAGTSFPNHAALGFDVDGDVPAGKHRGLRVKSLTEGLPGAKAGLQVGDVVTQIAGKRFKTDEDYLDATANAAKKPTYEVAVLRSGKEVKLTVERAFRPTWNEQVTPIAPPAEAPQVVVAAAPSVADELGKLAKLKAEGIITEGEFEAQKKKLLER